MSEANHKPVTIQLAAGVELVVRPNLVTSEISERHLERVRTLFDRQALVAEIRAAVDFIFEHAANDAEVHFDRILEMVGWTSNRTDNSISMLAAAIVSLVEDVVGDDLHRLADIREVAEIEMHKFWGRRDLAEEIVELRDQVAAGEQLATKAVAS